MRVLIHAVRSAALLLAVALFPAFNHAAPLSTAIFTPKQTLLTADRVALPTTKVDDMLWVDARINGAGPFRLLVDTGSVGLALPSDIVQKAHLEPSAEAIPLLTSGEGGNLNVRLVHIDRLECGEFSVRDFSSIVTPQADWDFIRQYYPFCQGIIGIAAFSGAVLEIDFPKSEVSVSRRGAQTYPAERGATYTVDDGGVPLIEAEIDGKHFPFILDTGARGIVLSLEDYDLAEIQSVLLFPPIPMGFSAGIGRQNFSTKRSQITGDVRIGAVILRNPPVQTRQNALIGAQALSHWKLILDQENKRIYFVGFDLTADWPLQKPPALQLEFGIPIKKRARRYVC
jgi:predicted aspartyl protease